jgi:hypothetical protein
MPSEDDNMPPDGFPYPQTPLSPWQYGMNQSYNPWMAWRRRMYWQRYGRNRQWSRGWGRYGHRHGYGHGYGRGYGHGYGHGHGVLRGGHGGGHIRDHRR